MTQLTRILAATDLSTHGNHAVRRAAELAATSGAKLMLIHAMPREAALSEVLHSIGARADGMRDAVAARLQALVDELAPRLRQPAQWALAEGKAHRVVAEAAAEFAPDLLVIGAHGEGAVQQFFLGGTAAKLLVRGPTPTLVVRSAPAGAYRSVLAATDLGERSTAVIQAARTVAPHGSLKLLHAYGVPYEARLRFHGISHDAILAHLERERENILTRLRALVSDLDPPVLVEAVHGHPNTVLLTAASKHDLVVVGRHSGRTFVENLLGSTPRFLAYAAPCDVLIV